MAERMQLNKGKYPRWNWKKDMDVDELYQAIARHFVELMKGNTDDEQQYGHLVALACNAMMIIENYENKSGDEESKSTNPRI